MSKTLSSLVLTIALLAPAAASAKRTKKAAPEPAATEAAPADEAPAAAPASAPPADTTAGPPPAAPSPPVATSAGAPTDEVVRKRVGVGYKIGNGMGFVGGDIVVNVVDHLALDVQANWMSEDVGNQQTATGWGFGAEAQLFLKAGQVSSPYLGLGLLRASMSVGDATASATGYFANVGYEFRWSWGLGILLGLGGGYIGSVHAQSATQSIDVPAGGSFNLEAGLRYMFL